MFKIKKISSKVSVNDAVLSDLAKKRAELLSMPKQMLIGFYANVKESDLRNYLLAKASSNMLVDNAFYGIKKFENGYLWELQEGGAGKGVLSSLSRLLKEKDDIIISTSSRSIRVMRKSTGEGITSFVLNDDDDVNQTPGVEFTDNLKNVKSTGFGAFAVTLPLGIVGLLAPFIMLFFKYGYFDQSKSLEYVVDNKNLPITQIDQIHYAFNDPSFYLNKLHYNGKDGWQIDSEIIKIEKEDSKQPNIEQGIQNAMDKLGLNNSEEREVNK